MKPIISYLRVSTQRQGASGLGLEAQRETIARHTAHMQGRLVREYVEVESGRKNDRPELQAALADAKRIGAVLVVAKLDRLARDAHFLLGIMKAGVDFVACDNAHANRLTLGILAVVAEEEARAISARTREALAARRARGLPLGWAIPGRREDLARAVTSATVGRIAAADAFAARIGPRLLALRKQGLTFRKIAEELNELGVAPPRPGGRWHDTSARNVLARFEALQAPSAA